MALYMLSLRVSSLSRKLAAHSRLASEGRIMPVRVAAKLEQADKAEIEGARENRQEACEAGVYSLMP